MLTEDDARKLRNDVALATDDVYLQNVLKKLTGDESQALAQLLAKLTAS